MSYDLTWSWCNNNRNKVHNKCNVLESSQNHPSHSVHGKILFSRKQVPDAKKVGDGCIKILIFISLLCVPDQSDPHIFLIKTLSPKMEKWCIQDHTAFKEQNLSSLVVQHSPSYHFEMLEAYLKTAWVLSPHSRWAEFWFTSRQQPSPRYCLHHHFLKCTQAAHFKAGAKDNPK